MDAEHVVRVPGLLDLSALWQVYDEVDRPDLKDRPFVPATHPRFAEGETPRSVFARLRDGDILVHHPYHSFSTSVQRFIEQAAADPNVLAIKQTLYRTSGDSPVVDALIAAAEAGKQVVVLVELKARFDEQANIGWARMLERAGCHVVYGLVGLKTHCKTALVVRQEGGQIRRYCHIGTGNYHPKTARIYEDFGLLTADPEVGADLTDLFNVLTGYSRQTAYRRLLVAPHGVRVGHHRADRARDRARPGRPCRRWSRSRSTLLWTRRSSTRSTGPARPASTSTWSCAASARCARACRGCRSASGSARSSAGSWSTRGCFRFGNDGDDGVLDRLGRPHAPQPGPPGRGAGAGDRPGRPGRAAPGAGRRDEPTDRRLRPRRRRQLASGVPTRATPLGRISRNLAAPAPAVRSRRSRASDACASREMTLASRPER